MLDFRRIEPFQRPFERLSVKNLSKHLARLRVPLSWAIGLVALYIANPTLPVFIAGVAVGALGQVIRVWAAGHLVKGEELTQSGPYAMTRNPLYFGSCLMGLGFAVASGRWELLVVLGLLMISVFLPVMRREATELAARYPQAYADYAESVPLFFPKPGESGGGGAERCFSWGRLRKNREHITLAGWASVVMLLWWKMQ